MASNTVLKENISIRFCDLILRSSFFVGEVINNLQSAKAMVSLILEATWVFIIIIIIIIIIVIIIIALFKVGIQT